jgi:hypothetical protein
MVVLGKGKILFYNVETCNQKWIIDNNPIVNRGHLEAAIFSLDYKYLYTFTFSGYI